MDFNVKGITFNKDQLSTIKLSDIKTETISRSHFFHLLSGSGKAILLLRAGDFVEPSFVSKYLDKGMESIYQLEICSNDELLLFKNKWNELKNAKSQEEQFEIRDSIISLVAADFWNSKENSFLSLVISCFEEFYIYPPHVLDKYQDVSILLYTRALLISTVSCISSLCFDHVDYKFIKDFYNTSFIMDYGLVELESFNYSMSLACEHERKLPGSGINFLKKSQRSTSEVQAFIHHPSVSYRAASEFQKEFSYPEILEMIKMHHEKYDGTGFPKGYSYSGMSNTETMLTFCDYLIPFAEHVFVKGDGHLILSDYIDNLKTIGANETLPIQKLIASWQGIMNWATKKNEVAS